MQVLSQVHASYLLSLSYADLAVGGGFLPLQTLHQAKTLNVR